MLTGSLTNSSEFRPNMENHDDGHYESENVRKVGRALEDDGIGQFNRPGIACRLNADMV